MPAADDLLVRLVAEHTGVESGRVRVGRLCGRCGSAEHGRPHARVEGVGRVHVSLARAGDLVLAAACRETPVGVDLEAWTAFPRPGFAEVALHARERADDATAQALTWVRKESLLKALGLGLAVDPRAVRLGPTDQAPRLVAWHGPDDPPLVTMRDLQVPGHTACLTGVAAREPRVSLRWAAAAAPARPATPGGGRPGPAR